MHKIGFCCTIWVDLAQYGTLTNHPGVSTEQNYNMKLENEIKIPNSLCMFGNSSKFKNWSIKYLLCFLHTQKTIIWLDFKQSQQKSFLRAYFKENNKTMAVNSTLLKLHI